MYLVELLEDQRLVCGCDAETRIDELDRDVFATPTCADDDAASP
jgi:hypothetical protein